MIEYGMFPLLGTAILAVLIGAGVFWGNTFIDREIERREAVATIVATFVLMIAHIVMLLAALVPAEPISPDAFRTLSGVWALLVILLSGYFFVRGIRIRIRDAQEAEPESGEGTETAGSEVAEGEAADTE